MHWLTKTREFWRQCDEKSRGTSGKNRIRPERFLEIPVPLPPLDEQRALVRRIDSIAARTSEAMRLRREALSAVDALLQAERSNYFGRSDKHECVFLEDVCAAIIDTLHSDPIYSPVGIPCVRSPDIAAGRLNLKQALRTSEEEYLRRTVRCKPAEGDIVYCRQGGGTGRAAVVRRGDRFSLGQAMMVLRPNRQLVHPDYLLHQLLSPAVIKDQLQPCYIGTASPRINIGSLRKFRLTVPNLARQHEVVAHLSDLERLTDALSQVQSRAEHELSAILPAALNP
jgi:type I restriction enzyme, S subunit